MGPSTSSGTSQVGRCNFRLHDVALIVFCCLLWPCLANSELLTVTSSQETVATNLDDSSMLLLEGASPSSNPKDGATIFQSIDGGSTFSIPTWSYTPQSGRNGEPVIRKPNAYATMMYCGTARDYEFYTATRVLFKGLLRQQPDADLVVMVSTACPMQWLEEYSLDGLRVILVDDIPNPYKNQDKFDRRFISSLNKLYAWSLTDYNRVVMLDADNIFLQNTDELFQCGQFCAVFIDPCQFHTGLFVVEPSNHTFLKMLKDVGHLRSRDGGDQGFLISYFSDLLNQPLFRPPANGSALNGYYRLPFGYQMDTSYYYWRMKWRVPCGPNSVMTFPGVSMLKPWYWYTWPILPLGLTWHEERRTSIGYAKELPAVLLQVAVYLTLILMAVAIRHRFCLSEKASSFHMCAYRTFETFPYPFCHPWALKGLVSAYIVLSIGLPVLFIPTIVHPVLGYALYFLGLFSMLLFLGSFLQLPLVCVLTPWMILVTMWINLASPIYSHGLPRMLLTGLLSTCLSPILYWSLKETIKSVDGLIEREPLMTRYYPRRNK